MLFLQMSAANYARAESFLPSIATIRPSAHLCWNLPVPSFAAQCRQADAGGVEAAIDGENLPRDVA
jgi:hypothetical protein